MKFQAMLNEKPIGPVMNSEEAATSYLVRKMNARQGKGNGPATGRIERIPDSPSNLEA